VLAICDPYYFGWHVNCYTTYKKIKAFGE